MCAPLRYLAFILPLVFAVAQATAQQASCQHKTTPKPQKKVAHAHCTCPAHKTVVKRSVAKAHVKPSHVTKPVAKVCATPQPVMEVKAVEKSKTETVVEKPQTETAVVYQRQRAYNANFPAKPQPQRSKVHVGIEAGVTRSGIHINEPDNGGLLGKKDKTGFLAGGTVDVELSKHFAFQPGVRYIEKGGITDAYSLPGSLFQVMNNLRLDYVEVPLDLVVKTGNVHTTRLTIGAGPYVAYMVRWKDKISLDDEPVGTISGTKDDATDVLRNSSLKNIAGIAASPSPMRNIDCGLGGFIGFETPVGVYAKAGAETGLVNFQQSRADGNYYNRNYNFLFSLGYFFGYKQ